MSNFTHKHAAHCESGVMSSMLSHHGLTLSEPMVFGLSSAMTFVYLPFVKLGGLPLIAYRGMPKSIIKNIRKNLGIKMKLETFKDAKKGEERLDELLSQGRVVGAQTSVYWLEYFPDEMRFHFNAHNLIVYDKKDAQTYLVSDPVFEEPQECGVKSLNKARFVKGVMAPKGLLYYPEYVPTDVDLKPVIIKSIHKTAKRMLKTPVPIEGLKAIKLLAKSIRKLKKGDKRYAKLFLGHIVRMQEEIGTGGAGFRYVYAAFLKESSELFNNDETLQKASTMMLEVGDEWRDFALNIAKAIKPKKEIPYDELADQLLAIGEKEAEVYRKMLEFHGRK